jgi:CHAT domain-containing protein
LKRLTASVIALFGLAITCAKKDTEPPIVWPRSIKPRLTTFAQRVTIPAVAECADLDITTHVEAVSILAFKPKCTDEAINALQRFAGRDARAMSDLAAAYYLRAERQDRPSDYLRAWDAVSHALASAPNLPEARINRDLIEEELGLRTVMRKDDALVQWEYNAGLLTNALRARDRAAVARLIAPFPYAAERYPTKNLTPGDRRLLADEISHVTGEPVEGPVAAELQKNIDAAYWNVLTLQPDAFTRSAAELEAIEHEARVRGYGRIALRALVTHAWCRLFEGRYLDSLLDYDKAIAQYEQLGDADAVTDARMRRISALRGLGQYEAAWREAYGVIHESWRLTQTRSRETLLNEVCSSARDVGVPSVALRYADTAIDFHRHVIATRQDRVVVDTAQKALAGALSVRAKLEVALDRAPAAEADLNEAMRLSNKEGRVAQEHLRGRIEAARGELLLHGNPARAIIAFTTALESSRREPPTARAALYFQRAEAGLALGRDEGAESDFVAGLKVLRDEELGAVRTPQAAIAEEYWSGYFSRFQESVRRFVSYLVDRNRAQDAFAYAERARAFEPLSRLMQPADIDAITPAQIQAELPADTIILEYCVLADRTIVWTVSHDRIDAQTLDVGRNKADRWSRDLRDAAHRQDVSTFETVLNAASAELLARPLATIGSRAKRLVIVPDGPLHALPFAALRNRVTGHYLIEDYPIATAGSAKLYLVCLRLDRALARSANGRVLLIGDPAVSSELSLARGLPPLRHARSEVDQIAQVYSDAEKLVGAEATIPRFFARAPGCAVIHIAAHAISNPAQPSHSLIVLAPSEHDSGALDAERLLTGLPLKNTRLVVLSACSSAGGLPIGPEGVAPLVRPLIAAGVPAVIGSLWDVNDATAEALLVSFHRHYGQGLDAAAAMQAAQVEMIGNTKNTGFQRPLAWAPFQVIGYSASPASAARHN